MSEMDRRSMISFVGCSIGTTRWRHFGDQSSPKKKNWATRFGRKKALWIGRCRVKRIFTVVASVTTIKAAGQPKTQRSTMASNSNEETNEKRAPNGKSRILFGSCNSQEYPQPLWPVIASRNATAFVWAGDAIYAGELYFGLHKLL